MGWGFGFSIDTGNGNMESVGPSIGETYNVSKVYDHAFKGTAKGWESLSGMRGQELVKHLNHLIKKFRENEDLYRKWVYRLEFDNYKASLEMLIEFRDYAQENPLPRFQVG